MLGLLFGKKEQAVKINMTSVIATLGRRYWDVETVTDKSDVVVVKGKYRNHKRDFSRLFVYFVGGQVEFKDERGRAITHIPKAVSMDDMYPTLKNIMNVL
jgi:hypothetical protein